MNPQEFSWNEDQQVTVTNPTELPYKFKVHSKDYQVGAHKTVKMPGYIAWVFVYGISTQLAQADDKFNRWNEEGFRQEYYERVVKHVDPLMQDIEDVEDDNSASSFDEVDAPSESPAGSTEVADEEIVADDDGEEGDDAPISPAPDTSKIKPMTAQPKAQALRSGNTVAKP